ncbi:MAG: alpha/beta fold hydrolase [Pseudomonadota bacterium]
MIDDRPFEVDAGLYPFEDRWMDVDGVLLHYLDEGHGTPVLLLHGNPTWSFLYRDVITALRGEARLIAPDYPGFGMSDHPEGYGYTPAEHAAYVRILVDRLGIEDFVVVMQDWGGPIGIDLATRRPARVAGLTILNTWAWPADAFATFFSVVMGGPWGPWLQQKKNFFATTLMEKSILDPARKLPQILAAYRAPFPTPASRRGTYVFPREIRTARKWLKGLEEMLVLLEGKPVEMVWAMKDPAFGKEKVIRRWLQHFPGTPVDRVEDAGHYLQEDAPDRVVAGIRRVLARI